MASGSSRNDKPKKELKADKQNFRMNNQLKLVMPKHEASVFTLRS